MLVPATGPSRFRLAVCRHPSHWYEADATDSSQIIYHPFFARFGRA
jgi:hypothetical protein